MHKLRVLLLLSVYSIVIIGASGCQLVHTPIHAEPSGELGPQLGSANSAFSLNLFKILARSKPNQDIFISPASISLALAMAYNGARGETATAMAKALQLQDMSREEIDETFLALQNILSVNDPKVELSIANSIWMREGISFNPEFLERNQAYYGAEVASLNFDQADAPDTINRWVKEQTNGKITEVIGPRIDPSAILFLINAIYFNADWKMPFNPKLTRDVPFHLADGSTRQHPLMFRSGEMPYLAADGFQAVGLPYGETGRFSMYVFLPDEKSNLDNLFSQFSLTNWERWLASFSNKTGTLGLPRFQLKYEESLVNALTELGMGIAFDRAADFSGMRPIPPELSISSVKHSSYINVDEKGTEAAAVTTVSVVVTSAPANKFSLIIDRPFFFTIVDNETGTILFMGAIYNPQ